MKTKHVTHKPLMPSTAHMMKGFEMNTKRTAQLVLGLC
jgi:hypothetical protein